RSTVLGVHGRRHGESGRRGGGRQNRLRPSSGRRERRRRCRRLGGWLRRRSRGRGDVADDAGGALGFAPVEIVRDIIGRGRTRRLLGRGLGLLWLGLRLGRRRGVAFGRLSEQKGGLERERKCGGQRQRGAAAPPHRQGRGVGERGGHCCSLWLIG